MNLKATQMATVKTLMGHPPSLLHTCPCALASPSFCLVHKLQPCFMLAQPGILFCPQVKDLVLAELTSPKGYRISSGCCRGQRVVVLFFLPLWHSLLSELILSLYSYGWFLQLFITAFTAKQRELFPLTNMLSFVYWPQTLHNFTQCSYQLRLFWIKDSLHKKVE